MMEKDQLRKMLRENRCEVTFTKVDGSVRIMPCTLREGDLPAKVEREGESRAKKENPDTISVWCLDKQEWRSFRVANVQKVEVLG